MRRILVFLLLLLSLGAAQSAQAITTGGTTTIIPVIGRFPGDGGTLWRTDVFVMNPSTNTLTVTLKFYATSGLRQHTFTLASFKSAVFRDIVLSTFGLEGAGGPLEIESSPTGTDARARIYNAGHPAGQFGQGVEGIAKSRLGVQSVIHGLAGTSGNRINIGVTNPNNNVASVNMVILDKDNNPLYSETFTVDPHGYRQFNNIVALYGLTPQDGLQVRFGEFDDPIYGFASEVRNDTGDAMFMFGISPNSGPD